jgi:hypothetical protein
LSTIQQEDVGEEEESVIVNYLFSKVSSLAQLEEGEEDKNMEAIIQQFHLLFVELRQEKLLTCRSFIIEFCNQILNFQFRL